MTQVQFPGGAGPGGRDGGSAISWQAFLKLQNCNLVDTEQNDSVHRSFKLSNTDYYHFDCNILLIISN